MTEPEITSTILTEKPYKDYSEALRIISRMPKWRQAYYAGLIYGLAVGSRAGRMVLPQDDYAVDIRFDLKEFCAMFEDINAEGHSLYYRLWKYQYINHPDLQGYEIQIWDDNDQDQNPEPDDELPMFG